MRHPAPRLHGLLIGFRPARARTPAPGRGTRRPGAAEAWNYLAKPVIEPFTEQAEAERRTHRSGHASRLEGLLVGGCGVQVYPMAVPCSDDMRISMEVSFNRGREFFISARGLPGTGCYYRVRLQNPVDHVARERRRPPARCC